MSQKNSKLKAQVDKGRDKLIQQLQAKVESLKLQRQQLLKTQQMPYRSTPPLVSTPVELHLQVEQTRRRLQQLQALYNRKKQLESLGAFQPPTKQIMHADSMLDSQKRKVVREELQKAKRIIEGQRMSNNQIKREQRGTYEGVVAREKGEVEARRFHDVMNKPKMTKIDQEYLLKTVFQVLQDQRELVSKSELKLYLTYNPKFCDVFRITKRQINNDLQVFQTQTPHKLSYRQFYELIKSIQLTAQALKPSRPATSTKPRPAPTQITPTAPKPPAPAGLTKAYLKHTFTSIDKKNQSIILRSSFSTALEKAMFMTKEFEKVDKLTMRDFRKYIDSVEKTEQDHYKRLSKQYISYLEVQREWEWFEATYWPKNGAKQGAKEKDKEQQKQKKVTQPEPIEDEYQEQPFQPYQKDPQPPIQPQPKQPQPTYHPPPTPKITPEQLQNFDQYYQHLSKTYQSQIHTDQLNRQQIQSQLAKLQNYIAYLQHSHQLG